MKTWERDIVAVTGLSRGVARAARDLALELAKCTTLSPAQTAGLLRRFLLAFVASYQMAQRCGLDASWLVDLAARLDPPK